MLAAYITCVALSVTVHLISDPFSIDPRVSPLHALFLVLMGAIFTLTMGSFLIYHLYLVSTNQTTLEHMSPYLLLRYLPALPASPTGPPNAAVLSSDFPPILSPASADQSHPLQLSQPKRHPPPPSSPHARPKISIAFADPPTPPSQTPLTSPLSPSLLSHPLHPTRTATRPYPQRSFPSSAYRNDFPYRPPEEHELSSAQRRLVRHTHGHLRLYNVGFLRNWRQVFGGGRRGWRGWVYLLLCGGVPKGDGRVFERGPAVRAGLERLARGLDDIKQQERRER